MRMLTIALFPAALVATPPPASDAASITALIKSLYAKPTNAFYSSDLDRQKLSTHFAQYYTDRLVPLIVSAVKGSRSQLFNAFDPRFSGIVSIDKTDLKSLVVKNPIIKNDSAHVVVSYVVYDGMDNNKGKTEYVLVKTKAGWRIDEQQTHGIIDDNNQPDLMDSLDPH